MKHSFQLFNIHFSSTKSLLTSLTKIFGINLFTSQQICSYFGLNKMSKLKDVGSELIKEIRKFILQNYNIQEKLQTQISSFITDLVSVKSRVGFRHKLRLPVRGQRTRTNHKTQKMLGRTRVF